MTALELLAYCNQAIKAGTMQPTTEVVVAQPGDLRAWPTYGVRVLGGTPTDPEGGMATTPVLVIITNMSDEEDDGDEDGG